MWKEAKDSNDFLLCFLFSFSFHATQDLDYELRRQGGSSYVGQRLASGLPGVEEVMVHESPKKQRSDFPQSVRIQLWNFAFPNIIKFVIITL